MEFLIIHDKRGGSGRCACQEEDFGEEEGKEGHSEKEETRQAKGEEGSSQNDGEEKDDCKEGHVEKAETSQAEGEEVRAKDGGEKKDECEEEKEIGQRYLPFQVFQEGSFFALTCSNLMFIIYSSEFNLRRYNVPNHLGCYTASLHRP